MTEERENELFDTLSSIVHGVNGLKSDMRDVKITLDKHSQILDRHSQILDEHSETLNKFGVTLQDHSSKLDLLTAKVDSIAEKVIENDVRLTKVEKAVEDIGGRVH